MVKETVLSVLKEIRDYLKPQSVVITSTLRSKDGRFVRNSDSTVTDTQEKLIWYPTLSKKLTWAEANEECKKMGCRLPTRKELESLLDITKYNPAIDKEIFPDTKTDDYYWTGDSCAWVSGYASCVRFYFGVVDVGLKGSLSYVRPVRSSQ